MYKYISLPYLLSFLALKQDFNFIRCDDFTHIAASITTSDYVTN